MPALQFATAAYERRNGRLPPFRVKNMLVEAVPQEGGKPVLNQRPGKTDARVVGAGNVRGIFRQAGTFNGAEVAVVGGFCYLNGVSIGSIAGGDLVRFASSGFELAILGGGLIHVCDGLSITVAAFPDSAPVQDIAFLSGLFLAARRGTGDFYFSANLDATSWSGINFYNAESAPDGLVALQTLTDEVWVFGQNTVEVWAANGRGITTDPLDRQSGRVFARGCLARDTVQVFDNTIAWIGDDGFAYRASAAPVRFSTDGIEEAIAGASGLSAWVLTIPGHKIWMLYTSAGSFGFDVATQQWCEWQSYGRANWRARVGVEVNGLVYAGDAETGTIWRLSLDALDDDGEPIEKLFTANAPLTGKPVQALTLELDATVGLQPDLAINPLIEMRYSRDLGKTWSDWRQIEAGRTGEYRKRLIWNRLGLIDMPGRVFEFRMTDAARLSVAGVYLNGADGMAGQPGRQR